MKTDLWYLYENMFRSRLFEEVQSAGTGPIYTTPYAIWFCRNTHWSHCGANSSCSRSQHHWFCLRLFFSGL